MAKEKSTQLVIKEPGKDLLQLAEQVALVIGFNPITDIFSRGNRINAVAQLLAHPECAEILEKLEGSPAGFLTDLKDGKKYSAIVRAQAMQDCFAQGAKPIGNEINIIKGRGMLVKNYYWRMIGNLGHEKMPSADCRYQMQNWHSKEKVKAKDQSSITFDVSVMGTWINKSTGEVEKFDWSTEVAVSFGGQYDTIDKAQGQVQRRAWKEFYALYSGIRTEDVQLDVDADKIEPKAGLRTLKKPEEGAAAIAEGLRERADDADFQVPSDAVTTDVKEEPTAEEEPPPDADAKEPQPSPQEPSPPPDDEKQTNLLGPTTKDLF